MRLLVALAFLAALAAAMPNLDNPTCNGVPDMCRQNTLQAIYDFNEDALQEMGIRARGGFGATPKQEAKAAKQLDQYRYAGLNKEQACSIVQYTTGLYTLWNSILRGSAPPAMDAATKTSLTPAGQQRAFDEASESPHIECAVEALRSLPGYWKISYRYLNGIPLGKIRLGEVFEEKAFMSCTSRPDSRSLKALVAQGKADFQHQLIIFPINDGTSKGHKIKRWSQFHDESEILFEPKTRLCNFFNLDHKHLYDPADDPEAWKTANPDKPTATNDELAADGDSKRPRGTTFCKTCKLHMLLELKATETEQDCKDLAGLFWHEALEFRPDDEQDHANLQMPAANMQDTARDMMVRVLTFMGQNNKFIPDIQPRLAPDGAPTADLPVALQQGGNRRKLQRAKNVVFTLGAPAPNYIPPPPPLIPDAQAVAADVANKSTWKKIGSGLNKLINKVLKK